MYKKVLYSLIAVMSMAFTLSADSNSGPNHWQKAPKLSSAALHGRKTEVKGSLSSEKNTHFAIQFFVNAEEHSSKSGEGLVFLGQVTVKTDKHGKASFKAKLPFADESSYITATATRLSHSELRDSSRFSNNVKVK